MRKVNSNELPEDSWSSPKEKYAGSSKEVSVALGRDGDSTDLLQRHPFDVEILRIPPGKTPYPFHQHAAQWEFYHVISGSGTVRHATGSDAIVAGDAFVFKPNEPHQLFNSGEADLVIYVIADNPLAETVYYPDSDKWGMRVPRRLVFRASAEEYYAGEE